MTATNPNQERITVENAANLSQSEFAAWTDLLGSHDSMRSALDWMMNQQSPLTPTEMIAQDEFSFDLVVPVPSTTPSEGRTPLWIVYSTS